MGFGVLSQIISKKGNRRSLVFSFMGMVVGLLGVFSVLHLWSVQSDFFGPTANDNYKYIQVNKQIGYGSVFGLGNSSFSEGEILSMKKLPYVHDVGEVIGNDFKVAIDGGKFISFYTELFLQAVPTQFLEVDPDEFSWEEGQDEVPIVISNNFYNLYIHGFAPSQGLPVVPKDLLTKKSFILKIRGKGGVKRMSCRIVGFTDRINSVLVPRAFLTWANKLYGKSEHHGVSTLVAELNKGEDEAFNQYLKRKSYVINQELLDLGTAKKGVEMILVFVALFAVLMLALALFQLISFANLMLGRNQEEINVAQLLGYSRQQIVTTVFKITLKMLLLMFAVAIAVTIILFWQLKVLLSAYNFEVVLWSHHVTIGAVLIFVLGASIVYGGISMYLKRLQGFDK